MPFDFELGLIVRSKKIISIPIIALHDLTHTAFGIRGKMRQGTGL